MFRGSRKPPRASLDRDLDPFELAVGRRWNTESVVRLRADVARADDMGMRANVFAKVGDSNLASYNALYGLGCRMPVWDCHSWLEPTMLRYREIPLPPGNDALGTARPAEERAPWNSFSRLSAATRSGILAKQLLKPSKSSVGPKNLKIWLPDQDCPPDESPLSFEIRLVKPRFVFVNLGTNGANFGMSSRKTAKNALRVVTAIRRLGPVPILMTLPPQLDHEILPGRWRFAEETSNWIAEFAKRSEVALFDQWSVLSDERLVNYGLVDHDREIFDGFHLETPGGWRDPDALQSSVDFRPPALLYGANLRNLLLLQTLATLDAAVGVSSTDKENLTIT
ncbi:MAG: SGNH/GDSL hydrolase family protein [Thermoleophilia bacterium]|nr:SGNH/GDSL hydrolase family protein [Thermoleophilia bacterium]